MILLLHIADHARWKCRVSTWIPGGRVSKPKLQSTWSSTRPPSKFVSLSHNIIFGLFHTNQAPLVQDIQTVSLILCVLQKGDNNLMAVFIHLSKCAFWVCLHLSTSGLWQRSRGYLLYFKFTLLLKFDKICSVFG